MSEHRSENKSYEQRSVSERALFTRLKRALQSEEGKLGYTLRKCVPMTRWHSTTGTYYTVDDRTGFIDACHIDLVRWCRRMKLLKPTEFLMEKT